MKFQNRQPNSNNKEVLRLSKVFYCYSPKLKCELLNIGERYIAKAKNEKSNRYYWVFLFSDELKKYLDNRSKLC